MFIVQHLMEAEKADAFHCLVGLYCEPYMDQEMPATRAVGGRRFWHESQI